MEHQKQLVRTLGVTAVLATLSTLAWAASQAPPSAPVTVVNTPANPVPVSVPGPLEVTVTNPVVDSAVTVVNPVARFRGNVSLSANSRNQATIIPFNTVPQGNKLIVTYANLWGSSSNSGVRITSAGCTLILVTSGGTSTVGSIPLQVNGLSGGLGVGASQTMFLPLSPGEGLALDCFTDVTSFIEGTFAGYFVPSP